MPGRRNEKRDKLKTRLDRISWFLGNNFARRFTLRLQPPDYTYLKDSTEYTYKFQPARPQKDPVIRIIRNAIEELNDHPDHGILMCNSNIRVVPSTASPPIWPPNAKDDNNVKFYTFFQDDMEFPATIPVSIIPRDGELTIEKVHVRKNGDWVSIKDWLLQLAERDLLRQRGLESTTYFWRKRSKKIFRLMDLPTELRLMIFELVIAPGGEPDLLDGDITPKIMEARKKTAPPDLRLLYVSKQIKEEALQAGWEGTRRCFFSFQIFTAVSDSMIGVAARFNILGRIELSFTNKSWFKFLGIEVSPEIHQTDSECLGHYLARLDKQAHLEIRFRDPDDGYDGDPWGWVSQSTTCQTIMVDWILALAFKHIKHIRDVKITGFVRKPQKNYWDDVFAKERAGQPHEHDNEAALQAFFNTPQIWSARRCICRKSCTCVTSDRWVDDPRMRERGQIVYKGTKFDFEDGEEKELQVVEDKRQTHTSPWDDGAFSRW